MRFIGNDGQVLRQRQMGVTLSKGEAGSVMLSKSNVQSRPAMVTV